MNIKPIKDNYTSTIYHRALVYVKARDEGKTSKEAYKLSHPKCKDSTASIRCYEFIKHPAVKQALEDYYSNTLPQWAQTTTGLSKKVSELHTEALKVYTNTNSDKIPAIREARGCAMDIAKLQGLTDQTTSIKPISIDLTSIVINSSQAKSLKQAEIA